MNPLVLVGLGMLLLAVVQYIYRAVQAGAFDSKEGDEPIVVPVACRSIPTRRQRRRWARERLDISRATNRRSAS